MKFIIFHNLKTTASTFGYQTSMKMAHLLNVNVACLGVGKHLYFLEEELKRRTGLEFRLRYILDSHLSDSEKQPIREAQRLLKNYNKTKSKSSKQVHAFQVIKRHMDKIFDAAVHEQFMYMDKAFDLKTFEHLINEEDFYFYTIDIVDTVIGKEDELLSVTDILQLVLPDPEKGQPLLFLNIEDNKYENIPEIEIHSPDSENAENLNCIYGEEGFTFPLLTTLSASETTLARKQLAEPTKEFREQLELWAEVCYANPNTNMGLDFFRKNIQPILKSSEHEALKSQILKNTSDYTNQNRQSEIVVGEAPIEKIWGIYRELNTISEETFNELLSLKTSQYPKFEGRWPIVFLRSLPNHVDSILPVTDTIQSVRKVIALD